MLCRINEKDVHELETVNTVQQTSFWARIKMQQGIKPFAFEYTVSDNLLSPSLKGRNQIHDDLLVLVRYIDNIHCFAYVPYGPV